MPSPTFAYIKEHVDFLARDAELVEMHAAARQRYALHNMTLIPDLPEHLKREMAASMPSPRLIDLSDRISAETLSYPTTLTIAPHPMPGQTTVTADVREKADELERAAAIWLGRANAGRKLDRVLRFHQLNSPYGVAVFGYNFDDADEDFPWTVETPHPLTCFFPPTDEPGRPSVLAIRYKMLVRDIRAKYTTPDGGRLAFVKGKWDWADKEQLSAAISVDGTSTGFQGMPGDFEMVDIIKYMTRDHTCHAVLNKEGKDGVVTWERENLDEGVPAVIVVGGFAPMERAKERYYPYLLPVYQTTNLKNLIRSIRASKSLNIKPDAFVERSADQIEALASVGAIVPANAAQIEAGGPNLITVDGKPTLWTIAPDPDLDKLEASIDREEQYYISGMLQNTNSDVTATATANAYLSESEAHHVQQTPILQALDLGKAELVKMFFGSVKASGADYHLTAIGGERYGAASTATSQGMGITLSASDLPDDFKYDVYVATRSETESDQRRRLEDHILREQNGYATHEQGLGILYTDVTAQTKAQAIDLGLKEVQGVIKPYLLASAQKKLQLRGLLLPLVQQPVTTTPGAPTTQGNNGSTPPPMAPPTTGAAAGGAAVSA